MIAFDTETHLVAPGRVAPKLVCISAVREAGEVRLVSGPDCEAVAEDLLGDDLIVGFNTAYDMAVLAEAFPRLRPNVWAAYEEDRVRDARIRAQLHAIACGTFKFDPALKAPPKFSLAELAKKWCGLALEKGDEGFQLRYAELDCVPIEEWLEGAVRYAKTDAIATRDVFLRLGEFGTPKDEALQCRAAWALHLMTCWGMATDAQAVEALRERLEAEVQSRESALLEAGFVRAKRGKNGQLPKNLANIRARIQAALGVACAGFEDRPEGAAAAFEMPAEFLTSTKQIKTDEDTLRRAGDPDLTVLADSMEASHELSSFIPTLQPLVQARYNVLVRSGRVSCSGPNMQNLPRRPGVRECFVPRKGYCYVNADIYVAELCALAEVCEELVGFSKLGDALRAGLDPHLVTGADIKGWSYEEIVRRYTAGDQEAKDARQLAKAANFGFPGGLGPDTFVEYARIAWGVILTVAEAYDLRERWRERYSEMPIYFRIIGDQTPGTLRQLRSNRVRGDCTFTSGCNTLFQGLVADWTKDALWELSKLCYGGPDVGIEIDGQTFVPDDLDVHVFENCLSGSRLVAFVHDEVLLESPVGQAEKCLRAVSWIIEQVGRRWIKSVPLKVKGKIVERWSK